MSFTTQCAHNGCGALFTKETQRGAEISLFTHQRQAHPELLADKPVFTFQCPHCPHTWRSWIDEASAKRSWYPHAQKYHPEFTKRGARNVKFTPAPVEPPKPPAEEVVLSTILEVPVQMPLDKQLKAMSTSILLAELFTRMLTRFDSLEHALLSAAQSHADHGNGNGNGNGDGVLIKPAPRPSISAVPIPIPIKRAPRIGIVGLLKDQYGHVRQKLGDANVELVFIEKDQRATKFPNVDALVVERHVRHRWTEEGKAALGNNRVFWAEGVTTVVQRCYDYLSRFEQLKLA